jgi:DNA-binding IclR family transcriptional regulator
MSVTDRIHLILELLQQNSRNGLTNLEISRFLNLPPSTCHRLLRSLMKHDYVRQSAPDPRYVLGYAHLRFADSLLESMDEAAICLPYLEDLHRQTEETAFYARFCGDACFTMEICGYINKRVSVGRGEMMPLYCSAAGQVVLAFIPKSQQDTLIRRLDWQRRTRNTITSPSRLREKLRKIRVTGVAINLEEMHAGVNAVAAPIFNRDGVLGAIAIVGPSVDLDEEQLLEYREICLKGCLEITEKIGGAFPPWLRESLDC